MIPLLRGLFFLLVVRPLATIVLGLNVRNRARLPATGPAILVANHNSHLDTLVLMTLFPMRMLPLLRPVAAADYFLCNPALAWFATRIVGILPVSRTPARDGPDPLAPVSEALSAGAIVILFPEGTRGEPERMAAFKGGVARLARRHPDIPVVPVFLHGLGKALPRGEILLVPFFCDVFVGEPMRGREDKASFLEELECKMRSLADEGRFPAWE